MKKKQSKYRNKEENDSLKVEAIGFKQGHTKGRNNDTN